MLTLNAKAAQFEGTMTALVPDYGSITSTCNAIALLLLADINLI